jgi:ParB family transcriptional regulator, chromosome partitioning protein
MGERRKIPVKETVPDPEQPRKQFGESEGLELGKNMVSVGQLVPVIVYWVATLKRYVLLDGERRWRAAQLVGIEELDAIVLPERPTETKLRVLQMSLEAHRIGLSAMERSDFLDRIRKENNWSVNELSDALNMSQPLVSKLLGCQKVCPLVRQLLHAGELDIEKAYVISQEPDHAKQIELAKVASDLSREQLRRQARGISPTPEQTTDAATFAMPGGMFVTVKGEGLALALVIDVLHETVTQLRKGRKQGLDITTQQRVMRDTAKAHRQSTPQQQPGRPAGKVG